MILKDMFSLFPVPVGVYVDDFGLTKEEVEFIENLEKKDNLFNKVSVDDYIFKRKELSRISNLCEEVVNNFFEKIYCPKESCKLKITQSWANYTSQKQSHHKHKHPNSFISGVFYISVKEELDKIRFFKSKNSVEDVFHVPMRENSFNVWNSESWWLPVKTGTIFCFHSDLEHCVDIVDDEHVRTSIAFNTFFSGKIGSGRSLTELVI